MIHAQLKLSFPRRAPITIVKNMTAGAAFDTAMYNDQPLELTFRPVEALRPNDIIEDCEFVNRSTNERFNLAAGTTWRVQEIELTPLAHDQSQRIITLVRVGP